MSASPVNSFDVFDTAITRRVAHPDHLHRLTARRLRRAYDLESEEVHTSYASRKADSRLFGAIADRAGAGLEAIAGAK